MSLRHNILALLLLLLSGCGSSESNQPAKFADIETSEWYAPVEVRYLVSDTLSMVDMQILMRYDNTITADSVELILSTTTPDGVIWSDEYVMQTPCSTQSHSVVEGIYRHRVRFSQLGEYIITFNPQHIYRGVNAVGVNMLYKSEN